MLNYKLQIGCFIIALYVAIIYWYENKRLDQKHVWTLFDGILLTGIVYYIFDMLTVYILNHLEVVNTTIINFCYSGFLISIDVMMFWLLIYMTDITEWISQERDKVKFFILVPMVFNIIISLFNMNSIEFEQGKNAYYATGNPIYACYAMVEICLIFSVFLFIRRLDYIEQHKRISIVSFICVLIFVTGYQMFVPDCRLVCLGITICILGIYINMENPAKLELEHYHKELVCGFSNVIEGRDGSTGEHIKRTKKYVELIADELRKKGYYTNILTKDYIENLIQAAPMHDIGKISTPDSILQKPARLTADEYEQIKLHTVNGMMIVKNSLGKLGDQQYIDIANKVVLYHHEQWDGNGYPEGLKEHEIPLCARIMAVADVFDAVVEERCYRQAMSLEEGFTIIHNGKGRAFDPVIVDVFLNAKDRVEQIYNSFQ